jgi:hypothetical protein
MTGRHPSSRAEPDQFRLANLGADNESWTVDIGAAIYDTVCSETGEKNWHDS